MNVMERYLAEKNLTEQERAELAQRQEDEDLREFCEFAGAKYIWLKSFIRHMVGGTQGLEKSDVVYAIGMAKQNGLPVTGDWYTPIPRQNGQGFSLCFRLDAAYYMLTHDDRVIPGTINWWFTDGKGQRHGKENPPSFADIHAVDWQLCCTVSAQLRNTPEPMTFTCRYKEWVAGKWDGGKFVPKPLWLKMSAHMLFKQTVKEWTRIYLGGSLEFEDSAQARAQDVLPEATTQKMLPGHQETTLNEIAESTGQDIKKLRAAAADYISSGGSFEGFASSMNKSRPAIQTVSRVQPLQPGTPPVQEPEESEVPADLAEYYTEGTLAPEPGEEPDSEFNPAAQGPDFETEVTAKSEEPPEEAPKNDPKQGKASRRGKKSPEPKNEAEAPSLPLL